MADIATAERPHEAPCLFVREVADQLSDRIAAMTGHAARTLLCRLVEDLVAHPAELGSAVAVLRMIDRGTPRRDIAG